jgi:hypothetical protein
MLNRILLGMVGLFLAFAAGSKLQLWLDQGKVLHRSKGRSPALLSPEEMPISHALEVGLYFVCVLGGLLLVWAALGGDFKSKRLGFNAMTMSAAVLIAGMIFVLVQVLALSWE